MRRASRPAWIRGELGVSVATAKRDRAALLELAGEMSLLDTLTPQNAPDPKGARMVRPLDDPRDDDSEAYDVNNKSASIRALLSMHPDGLGYDEISKATGIARDRVSSFIAALISTGDVKPYEFPARGRVFKYAGDPSRVGSRILHEPRKPPPQPFKAAASATEPAAPQVPATARSGAGETRTTPPAAAAVPKSATPPAVRAAAPSKEDAEPARVADRPNAPAAQPLPAPAARVEHGTPTEPAAPADAPATPVEPAPPRRCPYVRAADCQIDGCAEHLRQPAPRPPQREQIDLMTELVIVAAANLAAEVRARDVRGSPQLERALRNFDRADRLREELKVERT